MLAPLETPFDGARSKLREILDSNVQKTEISKLAGRVIEFAGLGLFRTEKFGIRIFCCE
jgi:hypothetical protein